MEFSLSAGTKVNNAGVQGFHTRDPPKQQLNNTALARIGQRAARDFKERVTTGVKESLTAAAGGDCISRPNVEHATYERVELWC